jgi:mannosyltransferase OCH1-like enzyme
MSVPKIIHQIWIGPKPAPINLMNTWKEKNPDFEYIFWNEEEFAKRNIKFICQNRINEMEEYCGKADIMRWEILYRFGGIYIDADSFCVEPIDDILCSNSFAGWENEIRRNGLIAVGTMGFCVNHEIPRIAIEIIKNNEVSYAKTQKRAWQNTGPLLLTNIYNKLPDKKIFNILPSYLFLPHHYTGEKYNGHGKIYAYQAWGSTFESYNEMNQIQLPIQFLKPPKEHSVSILISSYNTKCSYIQECLESIKHQQGLFNIELVWINDGSDVLNTAILKSCLDNFAKTTRFTTIVYEENDGNKGIGYTLNKGITMCSNEIIIKMDSDDIMVSNRIGMQLQYMFMNPTVAICGGQINMFKDNPRNVVNKTDHKSLTFDAFKTNPSHWFVNHPTLCYRKSCVLAAGNYDVTWVKTEDFELMLRMLKKYGYIHNMSNVLLYYRLHENQITHNGCSEGRGHWHKIRTDLINKTINS